MSKSTLVLNYSSRVDPRESTRVPASPSIGNTSAELADHHLVTLMRAAARQLVPAGETERDTLLKLFEANYRLVSERSPVSVDLRPWQLLASDLAAALAPHDKSLAQHAQHLADEIRTTVAMIARNPKEQLAIRPASRQVLLALAEAHGRIEHGMLRDRCGHSQSNFSNLLKPLRAHGLIDVVDSTDDRRSKIVILTRAGRTTLSAMEKSSSASEGFHGYIERAEPDTAAGAYVPDVL